MALVGDLIKALTIFRKYFDTKYPTNCVHDELQVCVSSDVISEEDKNELEKLSFTPNGYDGFSSSRFGSC